MHSRIISGQNWTTWLWSVLGAGVLNLALFLAMPHLLDQSPAKPTVLVQLPRVNVLHFKRQTDDVRDDVEKPPESRKTEPAELPEADMNSLPATALTLPFEIDTKLPEGAQTLVLPAPDFDASAFDAAFTIGDLDSPLTVLVRIPPDYPAQAKNKGIEGWVRVRFLVDESGYVSNAVVMEGNPPDIFDRSVIRCVSGWRFQAGTVDGVRVKIWAETTIWFDLAQ